MARIKIDNSLAKDMMRMRLSNTDTIGGLKKKYARIMRKYGIKKFLPVTDGTEEFISNPLWQLYRSAFIKKVSDELTYQMAIESIYTHRC